MYFKNELFILLQWVLSNISMNTQINPSLVSNLTRICLYFIGFIYLKIDTENGEA